MSAPALHRRAIRDYDEIRRMAIETTEREAIMREPFRLSSATASPSRDALGFPPLDRAVAGDSIDQGVIA